MTENDHACFWGLYILAFEKKAAKDFCQLLFLFSYTLPQTYRMRKIAYFMGYRFL